MESDAVYRAPQRVHDRVELERSFRDTWLVPKPMGLRATILKSTGEYIGRCGLYPHRDDADNVVPGSANIAYYIARPHWRKGLATEAARFFVHHGFETIGLHRIFAGINADNVPSLRIVENLGFTIADSGERDGTRWHDFVLLNPRLKTERR